MMKKSDLKRQSVDLSYGIGCAGPTSGEGRGETEQQQQQQNVTAM